MSPKQIAIVGGGLSGLSAAFHLSRRFPAASLTLLEKSKHVGGWVRSSRVQLSPNTDVLLEAGPRTLRPGAPGLMELVSANKLLPTSGWPLSW